MSRITPEMVRAAAEQSGLKLVTGTSLFCEHVDEKVGCPIDALLMSRATNSIPVRRRQQARTELGVSEDYLTGFIQAVDEPSDRTEPSIIALDTRDTDYGLGYFDGWAVRKELQMPTYQSHVRNSTPQTEAVAY